ncbi:MAG: CNNM domain-containing protein, partial [Lachnospiraceae bacterium]
MFLSRLAHCSQAQAEHAEGKGLERTDILNLLVLAGLLMLSAFFSSSETALTTVNRIRIRTLAERGSKKALLLLRVFEQPE